MVDIEESDNWMQNNNDTSNISFQFDKHIQNGRHRAKYNFSKSSVSHF